MADLLDRATPAVRDRDTLVSLLEDAAAETFLVETARRQADRVPTALSMSGLGGCSRANAYSLAGVPASDARQPEEGRAALLGTGIHDWFLPVYGRILAARGARDVAVEKPVVLRAAGVEIPGHLDLAFDDTIFDLKTVAQHRLAGVLRRNAAYDEHHVQVFGYALAELQAGRDVRWVVFGYMDRTTGEVRIVVEEFTNGAAMEVIQRITDLKRLADRDPEAAPREGRGPGLSLACDRCPWLRRCWGPNARPRETGAQVVAAGDYEGLVHALALYAGAAAAGTAAQKDKDFAKLVLAATRSGTYGGYKIRHGDPVEVDDEAAMKALLLELGYDVPRKLRSGATYVTAVKS